MKLKGREKKEEKEIKKRTRIAKKTETKKNTRVNEHYHSASENDVDSGDSLDFDPEDMDFGGRYDKTAAIGSLNRNKPKKEHQEAFRSHYDDIKINKTSLPLKRTGKVALSIDQDDFMDGKYAGKKVSKQELGYYKDEDEDEYNNYDGEDNSDEEEDNSDEGEDNSDDSKEINGWSSGRFDKDGDYTNALESLSQKISNQQKELSKEDDIQMEMIAKKTLDDKERGKHVRGQLEKWQNCIHLRIKLQPLLTLAHRIPEPNMYMTICEDMQVSEEKRLVESELIQLNSQLADKDCTSEKEMENLLGKYDQEMSLLWKESLDKWHQRIAVTEKFSAKKQMKVINQSLWTQMEASLRDRGRLLKRAFVRRSGIEPIVGLTEEAVVFDDGDYFPSLVKDWVDAGTAAGEDITKAAGLVITKIKQNRMEIDPRASKGRKMRYDVQDRIVNYMVPMSRGSLWDDQKIDSFFHSIFVNINDDNEDKDAPR